MTPLPSQESVVLVHGLGRSRLSLWPLQRRLENAGFATHNFPYAPTFQKFDAIVESFHDYVDERVQTERYHLLGHSLGNVIIRSGFRRPYRKGLGRIVMLAPPNQPPKLARTLHGFAPFRLWAGDSGQQLGMPGFYAALPTPDVPFGVIAGNKGQRLTFDEANDGIVTVDGTRLDGMAEHAVLPYTHTFIMNRRVVAEAAVNFFREGTF